jgi:hypothetical protein
MWVTSSGAEMSKHITVLVFLVFLFSPSALLANDHEKLAAAKTIKCTWGEQALIEYLDGSVKFSINPWSSKTEDSIAYFSEIDLVQGTAKFIGNQGSVPLRAYVSPMGLAFLEVTEGGSVMLTTIFSEKSGGKEYLGSHARHVEFLVPMPSLTYGRCEIWE